MIAWLAAAVREHLLAPQASLDVPEDYRCPLVDAASDEPVAAGDTELVLVAGTSAPLARELGGGMVVRHVLTLRLQVQDADPMRAAERRDRITSDLVDRLEGDDTLGGARSEDGRQELDGVDWAVDYLDFTTGQLDAYAVVTLTADVTRRPRPRQ